MMGSLTIGAAQQAVLRLLEGQETCNREMDNTHKICRKSQIGKCRLGLIFKERQYEDLDLRDIIFIYLILFVFFRSASYVFSLRHCKSHRT